MNLLNPTLPCNRDLHTDTHDGHASVSFPLWVRAGKVTFPLFLFLLLPQSLCYLALVTEGPLTAKAAVVAQCQG